MTAGIKKRIYFDHSATTRVLPEVEEAMVPFLTEKWGNPSSLHAFGREAKIAVEESRKNLAMLLNCDPTEIIFTSGGKRKAHIIPTKMEHHAVLEPCEWLKRFEDCVMLHFGGDDVALHLALVHGH